MWKKVFNSDSFFIVSYKQELFRENANEKKTVHRNKKWIFIIHTWSDRAFKGILINLALSSLHGVLLENTLTGPYIFFYVKNEKCFKYS